MPRKPTQEQLLSSRNSVTRNLELHVTGNLLPCSTYNRILDVMKENRDGEALPVIFVAYSLDMYLLLRESVPREYYAGLELRDALPVAGGAGDGGYRDAAGM